MTESWFRRLEDDVRHVTAHFHGHAPTMSGNKPLEPQGAPPMALADTAQTLQASHASALAELEDLLAKGRDVVDNHMTQIGTAIQDVAAVASIADSPLVAAAANALHCPPEVLDGFVKGLTALASAFPKPAEAQAEPAPDEQPADPQQEQSAA